MDIAYVRSPKMKIQNVFVKHSEKVQLLDFVLAGYTKKLNYKEEDNIVKKQKLKVMTILDIILIIMFIFATIN